MFRKLSVRNFFRVVFLFLWLGTQNAIAQAPPSGFANALVSNQWNEAVGLTFNETGTEMFVWERSGRVWIVKNNQKTLLLDIAEEVGGWHDHGLLGFALHPHFDENGYIYLLYVVDRHHLTSFGTGSYSPTASTYFAATIGRLTRYTAVPNGNGYSISPSSRKILIGETKSTGIPIVSLSHGVGSLVFGTDETLLVSTGDGASPATHDIGSLGDGLSYFAQALADNIISDKENVGAFRSQLIDCLNGKILRIDPDTGDGIPSNPYYDPAKPHGAASRVWALGLRNPFRMTLKPGTGSHLRQDGNPGTLYIGDVGWFTWEEQSVVERPGQNFGWPIFEGLTVMDRYAQTSSLVQNKDAPNPLFGQGGCTKQYFNFQDLIKQETPSGTSTFPNPCNTAQNVPASIHTFVHTRPLIDWKHTTVPSRTGIFNGQTAAEINIGAPGSPVSGPQFFGSSSTGGVFYTGTAFPAEYRNTYFFGDYSGGWIRNLTVDANDNPVAVKNFVDNNAVVVYMTTHPTNDGIYYVNFPSEIRRIYYSSNQPPTAVATVDNVYGPSPLTVQFTGSQSTDPEGLPLTYQWNFGDGSPLNNTANPSHTFVKSDGTPGMFTVTLKVTDQSGVEDVATLVISINNTPPDVEITSPLNNTLYPLNQETLYDLRATVSDLEHTSSQLSYQWQTTLHHETHQHPEPIDNQPETTTSIAPVGCDGETYFYVIRLTVTDAAGASTTKEVRLYPDCEGIVKVNPVIAWANPAPITVGTALSNVQLNATASYNGTPVAGAYTYTPPSGTVLGVGAGQQLSVNFVPTDGILYNSVSKTVTINVNPVTGLTFYRAINVNGPALLIDGNNWEASAGAPGFSYTTSNGVFTNQNITLVPATDANRATMIRSSVWGGSVNLNLASVPAGTYQVYVYVWEDNFATTFSLSLEGSVVKANHNSGGAGVWSKLGPYQATINDGAINVSSAGGHAMLSGLEIWRVNQGGGNQQPVVSNPIPNQTATAGAVFSYTFPTNIFSDPDAGTTLTYSATLSNGSALPAWLSFSAGTRTFSGTPAAANVGPIDVRVTASDGAGGSISDVFTLTVNPATKINPLITWANPTAITVGTPLSSVQLNATATHNGVTIPGAFTYTPPSGTVLNAGASQQLSVNFVPTDGTTYNSVSKTVTIDVNSGTGGTTFYRAINVNGPALLIDGNNWEASAGAPGFSYTTSNGVFTNQNITLVPTTDANRATMIRSSVWGGSINLNLASVPAGTYQVYVYVWEDNFATTFSLSLEGSVVKANHSSGGAGVWSKLGPYQATINDGAINVSSAGGHAMLSGLEIWRVNQGGGNQQPVVSNPIPNQTATAGTVFSYTFPTNTFSDPDAGTTLTYSATLSSGSALPAWLSFSAGTRTFSGTPAAANVGPIDVRVTASDGAGGSISDVFTLTVNPASGTAVFYRAINVNGPALLIDGNNWEASASAPGFSYTTSNGVFTNQNITLVPATDANRATMIRSSVWGGSVNLNLASVPAGTYQVYVYVWEDNFATTFSLSLEGSVVKANHSSGGAGVWSKLGPYQATINDGAINVSSAGGHAMLSGLEVWRLDQQQAGARMNFLGEGQEPIPLDEEADEPKLIAYPNPSSGRVTIEFAAKETAVTQLTMFNTRGEQVHLLFEGMLNAGDARAVELDADDIINGVYVLQLVNGQHVKHVKLALAR